MAKRRAAKAIDTPDSRSAAAEPPEPVQRRRRRSSAVFWRRRLIAILIIAAIAAIGAGVWLGVLGPKNTDFAGTWEGSQALLGSARLVFQKDGATYRIKGLEIHGQPATATHIDDGKLYATGRSNGTAWTVRFEIASDGRQLWAYYDRGAGLPELRLRLNRVPD